MTQVLIFFRAAMAGLLALGLAACSVMSPEQCKSADWGALGLIDGQNGFALGVAAVRVKACTEGGVTVSEEKMRAYVQARQVGLQTYCQMGNAVVVGSNGKEYRGVCPAQIDPEFRRRHAVGYEVYSANENVQSLKNRRNQLEAWLHDKGESEDKRRHYREEIVEIDYEIRRGLDRLYRAQVVRDQLR